MILSHPCTPCPPRGAPVDSRGSPLLGMPSPALQLKPSPSTYVLPPLHMAPYASLWLPKPSRIDMLASSFQLDLRGRISFFKWNLKETANKMKEKLLGLEGGLRPGLGLLWLPLPSACQQHPQDGLESSSEHSFSAWRPPSYKVLNSQLFCGADRGREATGIGTHNCSTPHTL